MSYKKLYKTLQNCILTPWNVFKTPMQITKKKYTNA